MHQLCTSKGQDTEAGAGARVDLGLVRAARKTIRDLVVATPLVRAHSLSGTSGAEVWLKLETMQPIGAFKLRGASHALARLSAAERRRGVVTASTGNHGRAVAYAARRLGIPAIVCLSALVSETKARAIAELGAEVRRVGTCQDDAMALADRLALEEGRIAVPPFDHPHVIAGQGTIALELLDALPSLASIVVPLSGGGLISGIAVAAKALNPAIAIVGVSMERGAAMQASLAAGRPVEVTEEPSLADSLGGGIGRDNALTFDLCRHLVDRVVLVSEAEIYRGMSHLFHAEGLVSEGAAAVGVAALLAGKLPGLPLPAALVISGRNVDSDQFLRVVSGQPVTLGDHSVQG